MWVRWVVSILALAVGGWMAFDGGRALLKGDYVTPSAGPYAGQLGPWASLLRRVGVDPRATGVKAFLLLYGQVWIAAAVAFLLGLPGTTAAMILLGAGALWYAPAGTVAGILQIALILLAMSPDP